MKGTQSLRFKTPTREAIKFSALLGKKILKWPGVSIRPILGMVGFYHNNFIFAVLPHTKAMGSERAINFKFTSPKNIELAENDPNIIADQSGSGWFAYEMTSEEDLVVAFDWLMRAYNDCVQMQN